MAAPAPEGSIPSVLVALRDALQGPSDGRDSVALAIVSSLPTSGPVTLAPVVNHDMKHPRGASLLCRAVAVRAQGTIDALLDVGARPHYGEDVLSVAREAAASISEGGDAWRDSVMRRVNESVTLAEDIARLREELERAHRYHPRNSDNPLRHASARARARNAVRQLQERGTLAQVATRAKPAILKCTNGADTPTPASLLMCAAYTYDVDLTLTLATAGARPDADDHDDVYDLFTESRIVYDASDAPVSDATLAAALRALYACGVRALVVKGKFRQPMYATIECAQMDRPDCVRFMVQVIHPHTRGRSIGGRTLLDYAAGAHQVNVCQCLVDAGCAAGGNDRKRFSPLVSCLRGPRFMNPDPSQEPSTDACDVERISAILHVLTRYERDVRPFTERCGLCMAADEDMARQLHTTRTDPVEEVCIDLVTSVSRLRVMMHMCAAAQAYPVAFRALLMLGSGNHRTMSRFFLSTAAICSDPMDIYPHGAAGVYIPDPYRIAGDVQHAIRFATSVDHDWMLVVREAPQRKKTYYRLAVLWKQFIYPCIRPGSSITLRYWAWMRRRQAVVGRVGIFGGHVAWR